MDKPDKDIVLEHQSLSSELDSYLNTLIKDISDDDCNNKTYSQELTRTKEKPPTVLYRFSSGNQNDLLQLDHVTEGKHMHHDPGESDDSEGSQKIDDRTVVEELNRRMVNVCAQNAAMNCQTQTAINIHDHVLLQTTEKRRKVSSEQEFRNKRKYSYPYFGVTLDKGFYPSSSWPSDVSKFRKLTHISGSKQDKIKRTQDFKSKLLTGEVHRTQSKEIFMEEMESLPEMSCYNSRQKADVVMELLDSKINWSMGNNTAQSVCDASLSQESLFDDYETVTNVPDELVDVNNCTQHVSVSTTVAPSLGFNCATSPHSYMLSLCSKENTSSRVKALDSLKLSMQLLSEQAASPVSTLVQPKLLDLTGADCSFQVSSVKPQQFVQISTSQVLNEANFQIEEARQNEPPLIEEARHTELPLIEEARHTELPLIEETRQAELPLIEETRHTELPLIEETRQAELPLIEETRHTELPLIKEKRHTELPLIEEKRQAELPLIEETRHTELPLIEEARHTELPLIEETRHTELPLIEEAKHTEPPLIEEARHTELPLIEEARHNEPPLIEEAKHTELPLIEEARHAELPLLAETSQYFEASCRKIQFTTNHNVPSSSYALESSHSVSYIPQYPETINDNVCLRKDQMFIDTTKMIKHHEESSNENVWEGSTVLTQISAIDTSSEYLISACERGAHKSHQCQYKNLDSDIMRTFDCEYQEMPRSPPVFINMDGSLCLLPSSEHVVAQCEITLSEEMIHGTGSVDGSTGVTAGGVNTSTGVSVGGVNTSTGVIVGGVNTSTGVTVDGVNTSTGVTVGGVNTSTGVTVDGVNTSTGVSVGGVNTSTGVSVGGVNTSTGVSVGGVNTSTGVCVGGVNTSTGVSVGGVNTSTGVSVGGVNTSTGVTVDGVNTSTGVTVDGVDINTRVTDSMADINSGVSVNAVGNYTGVTDGGDTCKDHKQIVQPSVQEIQPCVQEIQPSVQEIQPCVQEIQPCVQEIQPCVQEIQPCVQEIQPCVQEIQPSVQEIQPCVQEIQPCVQEIQPSVQEIQPCVQEIQPSVQEIQPCVQKIQPCVQEIHSTVNIIESPDKDEDICNQKISSCTNYCQDRSTRISYKISPDLHGSKKTATGSPVNNDNLLLYSLDNQAHSHPRDEPSMTYLEDTTTDEEQKVPEAEPCQDLSLSEMSMYSNPAVDKPGDLKCKNPMKQVFQWSSVYDSAMNQSSDSVSDGLSAIVPIVQSHRPLRVGLSRKQKVKHLHNKQ